MVVLGVTAWANLACREKVRENLWVLGMVGSILVSLGGS